MNVEPVTLRGRFVRLEPMRPQHAQGLLECADESCFQYHLYPPRAWTLEGFRENTLFTLSMAGRVPFVLIDQTTDRVIGTSSYIDIRPAHRGLEVGFTWIAAPHRGGPANPEMKLLLLRHAFESLGAVRVQLKCDARNVQSAAAIRKLGATLEGVLRKHVVLPDGYIRDSMMFSVIASEWPGVRAGLEARVAGANTR